MICADIDNADMRVQHTAAAQSKPLNLREMYKQEMTRTNTRVANIILLRHLLMRCYIAADYMWHCAELLTPQNNTKQWPDHWSRMARCSQVVI